MKFVETLFVLSRADLDTSDQEGELIRRISDMIGLDNSCYTGAKATSQVILDNKVGKNFDELYVVRGSERFY